MGKTYTLTAGRCINRDGIELASIRGIGRYDPTEVDALARDTVRLLNNHDDMRAQCAELQAIITALLAAARALLADKYLADPINADRMAPLRAAVAKSEVQS